jgi:hypothetical protein
VDEDRVLEWLRASDPAVAYQASRDLAAYDDPRLQERISTEGDGAVLLAARRPDGHWGRGFYQPKWTSTHYTLLELRNLELAPSHPPAVESAMVVLRDHKARDGGIDPRSAARQSDVCVVGMGLHYLGWFCAEPTGLESLVDLVLAEQMPDGGFNCRTARTGATHSSMHTSVSVIEGITTYEQAGYGYRLDDLLTARAEAVEFLLSHRLFRSHRTGEPIRADFTRLHHPARWHFDVLRGLDALRAAGVRRDDRMGDALDVVAAHRRPDGRWRANRGYPGEAHLSYPGPSQPSPWVTLIALRVLAAYPGERRSSP